MNKNEFPPGNRGPISPASLQGFPRRIDTTAISNSPFSSHTASLAESHAAGVVSGISSSAQAANREPIPAALPTPRTGPDTSSPRMAAADNPQPDGDGAVAPSEPHVAPHMLPEAAPASGPTSDQTTVFVRKTDTGEPNGDEPKEDTSSQAVVDTPVGEGIPEGEDNPYKEFDEKMGLPLRHLQAAVIAGDPTARDALTIKLIARGAHVQGFKNLDALRHYRESLEEAPGVPLEGRNREYKNLTHHLRRAEIIEGRGDSASLTTDSGDEIEIPEQDLKEPAETAAATEKKVQPAGGEEGLARRVPGTTDLTKFELRRPSQTDTPTQ